MSISFFVSPGLTAPPHPNSFNGAFSHKIEYFAGVGGLFLLQVLDIFNFDELKNCIISPKVTTIFLNRLNRKGFAQSVRSWGVY